MSTAVALEVERVGKRYRIGMDAALATGARETITQMLRSPSRLLPGKAWNERQSTEFWALRDVSFSLPTGSILGIIGRNGAGKSTLLKLLSEVTAPTEGEIRISGRVGSLLEVGTGFHPELSGRENIFLNAAILGMSKQEIAGKFDEIVEFSGVGRFLDTPVKRYSSGMYLRLAFAVAAHLDSDILIVDEVLAVGDAEFQKRCLSKIDSVNRSGRTVIFVSHNLKVVERLANRVIWLQDGRIVEESTDVTKLLAVYLHGFENESRQGRVALWENSGGHSNPWCRPLRMYAGGQDREPLELPLRHDQEAYVYIEYEAEEPDRSLTVGFALNSDDGSCVFQSFHTDQPEENWPPADSGVSLLRAPLPLRLLNEGAYTIELLGALHGRLALFEFGSPAATIGIEIRGGMSQSPYWIERRPGAIAPVLPWEKCESGLSQAP